MPPLLRRCLAPALTLLLAAAASACTTPGNTSAVDDDAPVINTAPRTTSRASSLVVIGYATRQNRALVEQAVAILRDHGELAPQRRQEIQRQHLERIEEIGVIACDRSCPPSDDILGTATPDQGRNPEMVDCAVVLNMPLILQAAREWKTPAGSLTALVLVHEQEHCMRTTDDRETAPVAAELRLACKLGNARLIAFVRATSKRLDTSGHWKD